MVKTLSHAIPPPAPTELIGGTRVPVGALTSGIRTTLDLAGATAVMRPNGVFLLDFRNLRGRHGSESRLDQLQLASTLMLGLAEHPPQETIAILPTSPVGQRALAVSGMLFSLAQLDARLLLPRARSSRPAGRPVMLDNEVFWLLTRPSPWARDTTPADPDLRAAAGPEGHGPTNPSLLGSASDATFIALLNPHRLPHEHVLQEIRSSIRPWLSQRAQRWRSRQFDEVAAVVDVVLEAVENVTLHAFSPSATPTRRSLVTLEHRKLRSSDDLRVRIVDNGCGIPASMALKSGLELDMPEAIRLVEERLDADPTHRLPGARGTGLPRMRRIAEYLDADLYIETAALGRSIRLHCGAAAAVAQADLLPLPGTCVSLTARFAVQT
jgi:anti-sigma regulatory factor (Ser/Thr protein kinase)